MKTGPSKNGPLTTGWFDLRRKCQNFQKYEEQRIKINEINKFQRFLWILFTILIFNLKVLNLDLKTSTPGWSPLNSKSLTRSYWSPFLNRLALTLKMIECRTQSLFASHTPAIGTQQIWSRIGRIIASLLATMKENQTLRDSRSHIQTYSEIPTAHHHQSNYNHKFASISHLSVLHVYSHILINTR